MYTILIVEDESIIARDIKRIVESIDNVSSIMADTYESAIESIQNFVPDLALIDIKLFEDSDAGIRIAQFINSQFRIPFMFLSGYATENYLVTAKKENPVTFIIKPVDITQLKVAVRMAIKEDAVCKLKNIVFHGRRMYDTSEKEIDLELLNDIPLSYEKINPDQIQYIKTFNHIKRNTILIKLYPSDIIVASQTVNRIMQHLPGNFVKIHSSFIINKNFVTGLIGKNSLKIDDQIFSFGADFKKTKKFRFFCLS